MKEKSTKSEDILDLARRRQRMAEAATADSRISELDDLRFLAGSPDNQWQWPSDVINTRGSIHGEIIATRPSLTINKLPQHVRQVTNDQRQNRPQGKVIPVSGGASSETADILNGVIRHIEYISDADVAYDTACDAQVTTGEGYFRLITEYIDDNSFDQEIKIQRIRNQFSVQTDPMMQDPCGADMQWCFLNTEILKEDFERDYPNARPLSSLDSAGIGDGDISNWISESTVKIAEYFYIEHENITINLYEDGQAVEEGSFVDKKYKEMGLEPVRSRVADKRKVKWCKINGYEILEEKTWEGKFIPVIRVVGNEFEIEGKLHVSGLVRNAKDAQRMYNYWASQEAEMLALAPKAPFIGYGGQFEGYEQKWKTANTMPWPYLEVNPDITDGQGGVLPLPQRSLPPMAQNGLIAAKMGASDDIKSTTGQYDSSLGQQGNEKSGKAILARERQTDTGTYHYVDNLARAIRLGTRQIIDLIPKIYDTKRIARIIGEDGEASEAEFDPRQQESVKEVRDQQGALIKTIYNPGVGTYDVAVITGPSYTTKRQEAAEVMSNLVQGNPELWRVAGDLIVTAMDWPGAKELAERLKRTIDPKLLEDQDSPELQQAQQQMQAMDQQMQSMHQMLQNVEKSIESQELEVKKYEAETKRISAVQAGMSEEQIQDIVAGTLHGMITSGDLVPEGEGGRGGGTPEEVDNPSELINSNPTGELE